MDSHGGGGRRAKRARVTPPAGGDAVDLISGLDDDVLLRVLGLLDDARDAVRTGALSRRWRGLWTRAPALRFAASGPEFRAPGCAEALRRYAASVDGVLARRTRSGCAIETLSILYATGSEPNQERQPVSSSALANVAKVVAPFPWLPISEAEYNLQRLASADAAQGWIRYVFRHGVKSFVLNLHLPPPERRNAIWEEPAGYDGGRGGEKFKGNGERPVLLLLDGVPSPVRLESMRLGLGDAWLRLPTTMKFASLTDLSLERIRIADGGAHLLGRLVSSASCPRLQKLCMRKIYFNVLHRRKGMRLDANVLSELWIEDVKWLVLLELRTPNLRVFHFYKCIHLVLRISAPRLEELATSFQLGYPTRWLEINGYLTCVRSLKICLWSHSSPFSGHREAENDVNVLLLMHCSSLTCLEVTLYGQRVFEEMDMDVIQSRVPQLPHITSLTVNISNWFERHGFGAGLASLLPRFRNLSHLRGYNLPRKLDLLCDHPDHWESNAISMVYLQELELTGFTGTDCELWFIKAVLTSAKSVRKVAISFIRDCFQHQGKMDALERMLTDEGMWTSHRGNHILTCLR